MDHILQNQPGSSLVLANCQVLAKRIQSRSKPECKNHSLSRLPSLSRLEVNWIWHVYWDPDKLQLCRTFVTMKRAVYPCSARGRHNQHGSLLLMFSVLSWTSRKVVTANQQHLCHDTILATEGTRNKKPADTILATGGTSKKKPPPPPPPPRKS